MTDFVSAARAEAQRRWPTYPTVGFSGPEDRQDAFVRGAAWGREWLGHFKPDGSPRRPRCAQCGCELAYPTGVHILDCGLDQSPEAEALARKGKAND